MNSPAWYDFAEIAKEIEEAMKDSIKKNHSGLDQVSENEEEFHFPPKVEHEIRRIVREEIKNILKENNNINPKILEYKKMERYI